MDQCRWWASSTATRSHSAARAWARAAGSALNRSMGHSTSCSLSKGLLSGDCCRRSASNSAKRRLKRRSISTSHWCSRLGGTMTRMREARPVSSCWCMIMPASMVLPRPTSSASSTRGACRCPTSLAMYTWWGSRLVRDPIRPRAGERCSRSLCSKVATRRAKSALLSKWPLRRRCCGVVNCTKASSSSSEMVLATSW